MILSMSGQAWLFLSTVLVGVGIGLFYDILRVFRKTTPHLPFAVQLEDLFFWILVTVGMFYFMLSQNYGEIRLFSLIGAGCGAAVYFAGFSPFVMKVSVYIVNYLKKVVAAAFKIITIPIRFMYSLVKPPVAKFFKFMLQRIKRYGKIQRKKVARSWYILRKKV